jgi:hypothetical protein
MVYPNCASSGWPFANTSVQLHDPYPNAGSMVPLPLHSSHVCLTGVKSDRPIIWQACPVKIASNLSLFQPSGVTVTAASRPASRRLARELTTVTAMMRIYCREHHGGETGLCVACQSLLDYGALRLDRCRFGSEKPTCANCPVHCYQRVRREQMRVMMRYAGPRMLWQHPVLAVLHWLDGFRRPPALTT